MTSALTEIAFARLAVVVLLLGAVVPLFLVIVHGREPSSSDSLLRRWAARVRVATLQAAFRRTRTAGPGPPPAISLARGAGGIVAFNGQQIAIDRFGSVSFLIHGLAGPRLLQVSEIEAVRLRSAKRNTRGHLQLVVRGVSGASPTSDEHTVLFDFAQQAEFKKIAGEIRQTIRRRRVQIAAPARALRAPKPSAAEAAAQPAFRLHTIRPPAETPRAEAGRGGTRDFRDSTAARGNGPGKRLSTAENRAYFVARWAYRTPPLEPQQASSRSG